MSSSVLISSYNDEKKLYAVFEENKANAWLYLCVLTDDDENSSDVIGDVFVCNTVELIEHTELDQYKPNLPPITKGFGHPEAVCINIDKINWEIKWFGNKTVLLLKNHTPWALISQGEKRGMCKAIKKSGPWGNNWNEKKYRKLC